MYFFHGYCSTVHNNQDVEATYEPIKYECLKKMWCIYSRILFIHGNKRHPDICNNRDGTLEHFAK